MLAKQTLPSRCSAEQCTVHTCAQMAVNQEAIRNSLHHHGSFQSTGGMLGCLAICYGQCPHYSSHFQLNSLVAVIYRVLVISALEKFTMFRPFLMCYCLQHTKHEFLFNKKVEEKAQPSICPSTAHAAGSKPRGVAAQQGCSSEAHWPISSFGQPLGHVTVRWGCS